MEDIVERLKPCPFCGHKPKLFGSMSESTNRGFFSIRCVNLNCPASSVSVMDKQSDKAAARWNTRANKADEEFGY